jgi:hypothetical protein
MQPPYSNGQEMKKFLIRLCGYTAFALAAWGVSLAGSHEIIAALYAWGAGSVLGLVALGACLASKSHKEGILFALGALCNLLPVFFCMEMAFIPMAVGG